MVNTADDFAGGVCTRLSNQHPETHEAPPTDCFDIDLTEVILFVFCFCFFIMDNVSLIDNNFTSAMGLFMGLGGSLCRASYLKQEGPGFDSPNGHIVLVVLE